MVALENITPADRLHVSIVIPSMLTLAFSSKHQRAWVKLNRSDSVALDSQSQFRQ